MIRAGVLHGIRHPEEMPAVLATRLRRPLGLTDEQVRRVEVIFRHRQRALQEIRRQAQPQVEAELDLVKAQIADVLDEKQEQKWRRYFDHLRRTWLPPVPSASGDQTKPDG